MTAQSPGDTPVHYNDQPDWVDDEIDLRQYIQVLLDWWREIVLITIIAVAISASGLYFLRSLETPIYSAAATVAIARVTSDVNFDERFRTLSDDASAAQSSIADSRRAALVGLVSSGAIAEAVIAELDDMLTEDEQQPAILLERVDANIVPGSNTRVESDLIRISATAEAPAKAAAIANAWAEHYVEEINNIYGQVPAEVQTAIQGELVEAQAAYDQAQDNLEAFVADNQVKSLRRQIEEKQAIVSTLQAGKQTAVATIVDEELQARSDVISAYIQALSENRLLGFTKEQEAKRTLLEAYIDAEVQNRLEAVERDREARTAFFNNLADAQLTSAQAVLDEQVQGNVRQLQNLYAQRTESQRLLNQARLLERQIEEAGDAAAETNALALALLKAQIFTPPEAPPADFNSTVALEEPLIEQQLAQSDGLPPAEQAEESVMPPVVSSPMVSAPVINVQGDAPANRVQLNVDLAPGSAVDAESQLADVAAIITALDEHVVQLDGDIETVSQNLLTGDNYRLLDQLVASELGVSAAISGTVAATLQNTTLDEETSADVGEDGLSPLSKAVTQRYLDLFDVGALAAQNAALAADSELLNQIDELYPQLFELGALSALTENVPDDNPLATISVEKAQQLLQLQGLEDIPSYTAAAEPLIQAVNTLDREIQELEAQLESESARELQLTQQRDLAWTTYDTLSNKAVELRLTQSAANSEVRLAAPAVQPVEPVPGTSITTAVGVAGLAGLMLGVFIAFLASFMDQQPPLNRRARRAAA